MSVALLMLLPLLGAVVVSLMPAGIRHVRNYYSAATDFSAGIRLCDLPGSGCHRPDQSSGCPTAGGAFCRSR